MTEKEFELLKRICDAVERIANRLDSDAKTFNEMVEDGRTLAVLSKDEKPLCPSDPKAKPTTSTAI